MITIIGSIISGILYRLGGIGKPFNTKVRDFGVPSVSVGLLIYYSINYGIELNSWMILALVGTFLAMFGSMTTYCTPEGQEDVMWWNWAMTGLLYGVSGVFFAIATGNWIGFGIRTILLGVTIALWSEWISWDDLEEFGRGVLFTVTLPIMMIGG